VSGRLFWPLLSLLLLLAVWEMAALLAPAASLPSPAQVARVMLGALARGDLGHHLLITLGRVAAAFTLSLVVGSCLGITLGRLPVLDRLLDFWVLFFLNLPALVTAILCFVWFGLTEGAALAAVALNKIPSVVVTLREGARTLDPGYGDLARVYGFGRWKTLRHVILPQLAPYLMVAARSGLALIWKIVLVVELLGRSDGIGFKLHVFFQSFDVAAILAYSLAFILVVQAVEVLVLAPLDRRLGGWRA
jgi:NitT/TauT family transport system permease protein